MLSLSKKAATSLVMVLCWPLLPLLRAFFLQACKQAGKQPHKIASFMTFKAAFMAFMMVVLVGGFMHMHIHSQ